MDSKIREIVKYHINACFGTEIKISDVNIRFIEYEKPGAGYKLFAIHCCEHCDSNSYKLYINKRLKSVAIFKIK